MGYIRHHAIVVTAFEERSIGAARDKALALGCEVSEIVESHMNGYCSFFVAPDGSKEGWDDSDAGDTRRAELIKWMQGAEEFDIFLDWAEVSYGDDAGVAILVNASDSELAIGTR